MANRSAGILVFKKNNSEVEVMLIHPGGPFWKNKNENAWSIPKGLVEEGEDELKGAIREFQEETGFSMHEGDFIEMEEARQAGGKVVKVWAIQSDYDPAALKSNLFKMEWPPKSGKLKEFPEADKAAWFDIEMAKTKIVKGQIPVLEQLAVYLEDN